MLCIWAFTASPITSSSSIKVVYNSEGLLGQLLVLDYPKEGKPGEKPSYNRWLFVNRISQTMWDSLADESKKEEKYFPYVYKISEYADSYPANSKALILGLGGGSIARVFNEKGFSVDVCELDKRIAYVAHHYFNLSNKVNVTVDDGRHYIRTCQKKYDLIVLDMFKGEDIPNHVLTQESIAEMSNLLNPKGIIIVNGVGYIDGNLGKAMRSVYKTFLASGLNVNLLSTDKNADMNNLLFFVSIDSIKPNENYLAKNEVDLNDAVVLTDEIPVLDKLNSEASKRWRAMAISGFNTDVNQKMLPVFK